jgi:hypothetical protein
MDPQENRNIAAEQQKKVDSLMPVLEQATPEFYLN